MSPVLAAMMVSVCVFGGGIVGLLLNRVLPERHLTSETTDTVRLGTGMLSVLAALVLGLLTATARDSLETADKTVRDMSVSLVALDQVFDAYGSDVADIQVLLRRYATSMLVTDWAQTKHDLLEERHRAGVTLEQVRRAVLALEPSDAGRRWLRDQALTSCTALLNARWELLERQDLPVRPVFLIVLTTWIAFIFMSFGLNAPCNAIVIATFVICSYAIGGSVFLIIEMETPFSGVIQIAKEPVEVALGRMDR